MNLEITLEVEVEFDIKPGYADRDDEPGAGDSVANLKVWVGGIDITGQLDAETISRIEDDVLANHAIA
jgi:hypothetical protein